MALKRALNVLNNLVPPLKVKGVQIDFKIEREKSSFHTSYFVCSCLNLSKERLDKSNENRMMRVQIPLADCQSL